MPDVPRPILLSSDGAVATLTLNRPDALNALTRELLVDLEDALEQVAADEGIRVVILTGAGRAFSAGVDLKALGQRRLANGGVGDFLDVPGRAVLQLVTTMPKVVIARVNGFCFTGALELALGCDLIVAAQEARFGDTHAKWGLRPSWGMSQRMVRLVGIARARDLAYTARTFSGADAAAWGLAVRCVPLSDLDVAVAEIADAVIANSAGSIGAYKDLFNVALDRALTDALDYEAATVYPITDTEERIAGFR